MKLLKKNTFFAVIVALLFLCVPTKLAFASTAVPLTDVYVYQVISESTTGVTRSETCSTYTNQQHFRDNIKIYVIQMGQGVGIQAHLDGEKVNDYKSREYILGMWQGTYNTVIGFRYVYEFNNVSTIDPTSEFTFSARDAVRQTTQHSTNLTIQWDDGSPAGAKPPAPNLALVNNYENEMISGFDDNIAYQYRIGGSWLDFTTQNGLFPIDNILGASEVTVLFREAPQGTTPASEHLSVTLPARPAAPTSLSYNSVTKILSGVNSNMQFRQKGALSWNNITGATVDLTSYVASGDNIEVRYKATSTVPASLVHEVNITTVLEMDIISETVSGFRAGTNYQYSTNQTSWSTATLSNGKWTFSPYIPASTGSAVTFYFRESGTTTVLSNSFLINPRKAAPTGVAYNNAAKTLINVDAGMQYRVKGTADWFDITGTTQDVFSIANDMFNPYIEVRYAPSANNSASTNVQVEIAANLTLDIENEKVVGFREGITYQYSTNMSTWKAFAVSNGEASLTGFIPAATGSIVTYYFRESSSLVVLSDSITLKPRLAAPTTIAYNASTKMLTGVTSAMQYRVKDTIGWNNITGTTVDVSALSGNHNRPYLEVRYAPTENNSASDNVQIEIVSGLVLDLDNEVVTGFRSGITYQYSTNMSTWKAFSVTNGEASLIGFIPAATGSTTIYYLREASSLVVLSDSITLKPRLAAPTTVTYNASTKMLTGVTSAMQYRVKDTIGWNSITGTTVDISALSGNPNRPYLEVRYAPTENNSASDNVQIEIVSGLVFDSNNEVVTGFRSTITYQHSTNKTSWSSTYSAPNGEVSVSGLIPATTGSATTYYFRESSSLAVLSDSITLKPRLAAPTTVAYNPSTKRLTGVNTAMQYRVDTSGAWIDITGTEVNLTAVAGTYPVVYIRNKGTDNNSASTVISFIIQDAFILDLDREVIGGLKASSKYYYGTDGTSWSKYITTSSVGELPISTLIPTSNNTAVTFYFKDISANIVLQETVKLNPRLVAPTGVSYDPDTKTLTGVTSDMQYRLKGTAVWKSIAGTIENVATIAGNPNKPVIEVRYKPTENNSGSDVVLVDISLSPELNLMSEVITGLVAGHRYYISTDGVSWVKYITASSIGELPISTYIPASGKSAETFKFKDNETGVVLSYSVTLNPRLVAPTGVLYEPDTKTLTGVTNEMQYRLKGTAVWKSIAGTTENVAAIAGNPNRPVIEVRYKPTMNNSGSEVVLVDISLSPELDLMSEVITGLVAGHRYYISTDGVSWVKYITASSVGELPISTYIPASGKSAETFKFKDNETGVVLSYSVTLNPRLTAPAGIGYDFSTKTLIGLSSAMQYKIQGTSVWRDITGDTLDCSTLLNGALFVKIDIRYKPTTNNSASTVVTMTVS